MSIVFYEGDWARRRPRKSLYEDEVGDDDEDAKRMNNEAKMEVGNEVGCKGLMVDSQDGSREQAVSQRSEAIVQVAKTSARLAEVE